MKRALVAIAMIVAGAACAGAPLAHYDRVTDGFGGGVIDTAHTPRVSLDGASAWTPPDISEIGAAHGWIIVSDTSNVRTLVAYRSVQAGYRVAIKAITKHLDGTVSEIETLAGSVQCNGRQAPNSLSSVFLNAYADNHTPLDASIGPGFVLTPNTATAAAVKAVCRAATHTFATQPPPASGQCSTPEPAYPVQAARANQQGVVTVAFNVTAGGHTSDLSVESSSGSAALDNAALASVSRATCNVPVGTHASLPVTFSLNQIHQ